MDEKNQEVDALLNSNIDDIDLDQPVDWDNWEFKPLTVNVTEEMRFVIDHAIEKAGQLADSKHPGHLLTLICADFLAS